MAGSGLPKLALTHRTKDAANDLNVLLFYSTDEALEWLNGNIAFVEQIVTDDASR
jgi:hypothetical protein